MNDSKEWGGGAERLYRAHIGRKKASYVPSHNMQLTLVW